MLVPNRPPYTMKALNVICNIKSSRRKSAENRIAVSNKGIRDSETRKQEHILMDFMPINIIVVEKILD